MAEDLRQESSPAPLGFGCFQLLTDGGATVTDYRVLELNAALARMLGAEGRELAGKRVSGLPGLDFGWLPHRGTQPPAQWTEEKLRFLSAMDCPCSVTELTRGEYLTVVLRPETRRRNRQEDWGGNPELRELWPMFDSTHDAMLLIEHRAGQFRYVRSNALHKRLSGFAEVAGAAPEALLGARIGGKLIQFYRQCVATGLPVTYEQEFVFPAGMRIWQTELRPIYEGSEVRYLLSCSRDMTRLRAVEEQNNLLTRRLRSMFELHDAMMLVIEPQTGRIVDANPAACAFYGYSREELLSLLITDINTLPAAEVQQRRLMAQEGRQRYFLFPHRLKNGETRMVDVFSCPISDGEHALLYSIVFDATEREGLRSRLMREKELLRTTLRSIGDGVVTTDKDGRITGMNGVAQELTGWGEAEAMGQPFSQVFRLESEATGLPVENPIRRVLQTGRIVDLANHTRLISRGGRATPIADSAAPIRPEEGESLGVVMVFRDVSKDKSYGSQIEYLSYRDPLTGLYNRRYMRKLLSGLDKQENLPLSILMGDVNGLKLINDVFGQQAGDELLRQVARALNKSCGGSHFASRWGGDEFMVALPRTSLAEAERIIRQIRENCRTEGRGAVNVSLSLGCAVKTVWDENLTKVIRAAEEQMGRQKLLDGKSYRNSVMGALLATLYERSTETEEHVKRLDILCHAMGKRLELSTGELDELSLLALLHDIGKVVIDQSILLKPGALTREETTEMRRHPEIGCRIARATPELATAADYILSHHERWDGQGYPRGLRGEEIPLPCRILAIADAYDAMTNDRVYRRGMSREEAIAELEANAGTQFDPALLPEFLALLREEG